MKTANNIQNQEEQVQIGVAGAITAVSSFSVHEWVAAGYLSMNEEQWRNMWPCHGGAAGIFLTSFGAGYSIGRGCVTTEGMLAISSGLGLILSDFQDIAIWFKSLSLLILAIIIAFLIGVFIGIFIRIWKEKQDQTLVTAVA